MNDPLTALLAELTVERFGPRMSRELRTRPFPQHGYGVEDNDITCAQRRVVLRDAMEDPVRPVVRVVRRRAGAA